MTRSTWCRILATTLVYSALASAASAGRLPRATPEEVGLSSKRLYRIEETLREDIDNGRIPGAVIVIARKGKVVYSKALGYRDQAARLPMTEDTIFDLASMTKPMVSVGALLLYEKGQLFLSDPVSKYFPSFGKMRVAVLRKNPATGKEEAATSTDPGSGNPTIETVTAVRPITIHDLLRHTSGLTYGVMGDTAVHKLYPPIGSAVAGAMSGSEFIEKLGTLPLLRQPGTAWEYGFSTEVLGLVLEKVTGKKLGDYLSEALFRPLGMADSGFTVSTEQAARYAKAFATDPLTNQPQSLLDLTKPLKFECGGGCAASTADDYVRFAEMLLNRGRLGTTRILGRKTVEYMTADHLGPEIENHLVTIGLEYADYGFGLGVAVRRHVGIAGLTGSVGDFNWPGAYGTLFWVDPSERLVVVFMMAARGQTVSRYRQLIRTLVLQAIVD